jgi:hypothetical protein
MTKHRAAQPEARDVPQSVRRGELLPLRTLMQRLGIGHKAVWELERRGLRGVTVGHQKYFTGDAVVDFFARLTMEDSDAAPESRGLAESSMPPFLRPDEVDQRLNWPPGRAAKLARQRRMPHVLLPDGSIRLRWDEIEPLVLEIPPAVCIRHSSG